MTQKPVQKPELRPEHRPEGKPDLKAELKPDSRSDSKAALSRRTARDPSPATPAIPATTDITTYASALRYLNDRSDIERMRSVRYDQRTFKLDRMIELLERLGNPQSQVRMVHVAGTVGKGSTVAMIAHMLEGCGYTVGQYTSPHLVDVRERVVINGQPIGKAEFTELMKEIASAARGLDSEPTFFEILTALGLKHFADQAVDIAVIEVGLGGRLDSTNVITPEVSVICTIDHDHNRLLGATLPEIAREKAGICKPGVPVLMFEQAPEIEAAIREVADRVGASLRIVNKDIEFSSRFCHAPDLGPHTRVCLFTDTSRYEHLPVPLAGEHQAINCGLALAAVDILRSRGFDCAEDRVTSGLARTRVRGRMQLVSERPKVLVDGAHNPASVGALMRCVGAHVPYDSMVCIFGCCADKDMGAMLDRVNLGADKVVFTRASSNPRAADPEELQRMFAERSGKMSQVARSFPQALELAINAVSREDLIVVTGSFYLVGDAMKHLEERLAGSDRAAPDRRDTERSHHRSNMAPTVAAASPVNTATPGGPGTPGTPGTKPISSTTTPSGGSASATQAESPAGRSHARAPSSAPPRDASPTEALAHGRGEAAEGRSPARGPATKAAREPHSGARRAG